MGGRICPGCGAKGDLEVCGACGIRTLREDRTEPPRDPEVGEVVDGRYRLDSLVRRGGMGAIFKATQIATGRVVALKAIRAEYALDANAVKRFLREARAASLLSHPHTIRMIDFGQTEVGNLYQVLEYLPGRTLAEVLTEVRALPERRVIKIASETAAALAEAHAAGLVHRDLKPENVMLMDVFGDPDFVKVFDLGIAKFMDPQLAAATVTDSGVRVAGVEVGAAAAPGSVVGTPHYMPPERATGEPATPAVDVYALGVIVFEALSGTRPFDAPEPQDVLLAHVRDPIPDLPSGCVASPGLRFLLKRMLAKDPAARPAAVDLVRELESLRPDGTRPDGGPARADAGAGAAPAAAHRTLRWWWVAGLLAAGAVAGVALWTLREAAAPPPAVASPPAVPGASPPPAEAVPATPAAAPATPPAPAVVPVERPEAPRVPKAAVKSKPKKPAPPSAPKYRRLD
ncbi:MAG: serine/threonine protein kinase [Deltaproteobacteria bacterium]|nr:serine/threonine protein kinase [Deltaproteobacteria bacterium]